MAKELIQIVDENDHPTTGATREEAQTKNLIHRIVIVYVVDDKGNVLLQKRGPKVQFANCWDHSAAGHVDAGESYERAAERELAEELGVEDASLQETAYYHTYREIDGRHFNRFHKVYTVHLPAQYHFDLQESELTAVKWFTRSAIEQLIREHPHDATNGLRYVFENAII